MYRAQFVLHGQNALLMHWDNLFGDDELREWLADPENRGKSTPGDDRTPPWSWMRYLYNDGKVVAMPTDNVMSSLMYGGSRIILKKSKTYKELSQSAIMIPTEFLRFGCGPDDHEISMKDVLSIRDLSFVKQCEACQQLGFRLFAKRATVGRSKHVRVRPRFDTWTIGGELTVVNDDLSFEVLEKIFNYSGMGGLCDWRPSSPKRPGAYGMYTAKLKLLK